MRDKRQSTGATRLRFGKTPPKTGNVHGFGQVIGKTITGDHNPRGGGIFPAPQRLSQVNGEFCFTLTERKDRHRQTYLFAGIQLLGAVLFVRPDGPPGEGRRWKAVLKPYSGPPATDREPSDEELDNAWNDQQSTGRQRR